MSRRQPYDAATPYYGDPQPYEIDIRNLKECLRKAKAERDAALAQVAALGKALLKIDALNDNPSQFNQEIDEAIKKTFGWRPGDSVCAAFNRFTRAALASAPEGEKGE